MVEVGVRGGLQAEELGAQGAGVDGERASRGWAVREGLWEEGVVGEGCCRCLRC